VPEAMATGMAVDTVGELGFPYWNPIRRRFPPDSPFFASGNVERELLAKQVTLDFTEDEINHLHKFVEIETRYFSFFTDEIFFLLRTVF
jgi:hypothetical protein